MSKYILLFFVAAAVLVTAGCGGESDEPSGKAEGAPKTVAVAQAEQVFESSSEEFMGTVTARNRTEIEAKVQARVERIGVALGTRVNKGDLLAELDTREYRARVEQARAVYEQAAGDLTRFEALLKQQAATQQEFDGVRARKAVAEATLAEAETYLSYAAVVAPFSGTVTNKMIDVGDLAVPGKPLFTIEESGALRFVGTLPESKLGQITVGDSLEVSITTIDKTVRGRVEELSPSADPISRSFTIKIGLPETSGVRPGQFGRLLLPGGDDETIFIPRSALVRRGQLDLVYVVTPEKKAMLRLIRIGRQFPDRLEILSGLRDGESVVVSGQRDLSDGDLVEDKP